MATQIDAWNCANCRTSGWIYTPGKRIRGPVTCPSCQRIEPVVVGPNYTYDASGNPVPAPIPSLAYSSVQIGGYSADQYANYFRIYESLNRLERSVQGECKKKCWDPLETLAIAWFLFAMVAVLAILIKAANL